MTEYNMISAPAFPSVDALRLVESHQDVEQAMLFIAPSMLQGYAPYPYLPVQAVPQGMTNPDLIADVFDENGEPLTTLHFCTIWHRVKYDNGPWRWERVSFRVPPETRHAIPLIGMNGTSMCAHPVCAFIPCIPIPVDCLIQRAWTMPSRSVGWRFVFMQEMSISSHGSQLHRSLVIFGQ